MMDETTSNNEIGAELTGYELAVIGMAGRFPGAGSISEFWEMLKNGKLGIHFFSDEELKANGVPDEFLKHPKYVKAKGVMTGGEYFDALFFDYTVREAETMDPQLRILHECCWHALEDAAYNPDTYGGSIGFFVGSSSHYYWLSLVQDRVKDMTQLFGALSLNDPFSMSTQVSYRLNLKGPVVTLNTACSTSLVAIHMACQALLSGECDMALAGGVSFRLPVCEGYFYQEGMVMSPDGYCRAFDARAAGTVGGNGVGIVVLKSLENAIEDGDHIYAIVKGSAVNNDGNRRVGYAAPSVEGQAEVIRMAQQAAEIESESITYIETHGTATILGDPVEIRALTRAFTTEKKSFCRIGAVKASVGHLDAAAGVTGFIKTVLAISNRMLPPSLYFETANPAIDFKNSPFVVNTKLIPWMSEDSPLRAGVSSFGIGGTNAHIVLEESGGLSREEDNKFVLNNCLLVVSARSVTALERNSHNLVSYLREHPYVHLADVAYTLQMGRKGFEYRRALVCSSSMEAVELLSANSKAVHTGQVKVQKPPVVFMFSGLGGQYIHMGYDLYNEEPFFREMMERGFSFLKDLTGIDAREIVYPSIKKGKGGQEGAVDDRLNQPEIIQPLMFIFEYALAQLLIQWGIRPFALIGYSFGEYTAACTSGVFSFEDALTLIVTRGELVKQTAPGVMVNVPMAAEDLLPIMGKFPALSIAIDNGPSCIVAGIPEAVAGLEKELKERKCITMRLHAGHAIHTRLMAPILDRFREKLAGVTLKPPQIRYISNVTGHWISGDEATNPGYWTRHLSEKVRFDEGIRELVSTPGTIFIEVGPGRDLSSMIHRYLQEDQRVVNLIRPEGKMVSDSAYLLDRLGLLWINGLVLDWKDYQEANHYKGKRFRLSLPGYAFDRHKFMLGFEPREQVGIESVRSEETVKKPILISTVTLESDKDTVLSRDLALPRDVIEEQVTVAFHDIFGIEGIGIDDDFFELGGDSLKVISLVANIHRQMNVEVPMEEVFKHPTVKDLSMFIRDKAEKNMFSSIPLVEEREYYPLSPMQKRVFIMEQIEGRGLAYNQQSVLWWEGPLDIERMSQICRKITERHESLRTGFFLEKGDPVQCVFSVEEVGFEVELIDMPFLEEAVNLVKDDGITIGTEIKEMERGVDPRCDELRAIVERFQEPFDLAIPPLWRVGIIKGNGDKGFFLTSIHHIISDDISIGILMEEIRALYHDEEVAELPVQYKDYAVWYHDVAAHDITLERQKQFWLKTFRVSESDELPLLDMPYDFSRPERQSFIGGHTNINFPPEIQEKLHDMAKQYRTTLFVLMFTLYTTFLYKCTGQEDIIVGTPITGRSHLDVQGLVGMFVNTLALRTHPVGDKTFEQYLGEVRQHTLDAFSNQFYQFENLVEQLDIQRDMSRNPLFDTMFVLHTVNLEKMKISDVTMADFKFQYPSSKFDLSFNVSESSAGVRVMLEYSTDVLLYETVLRYCQHFIDIVLNVLENPKATLDNIVARLAKRPISPEDFTYKKLVGGLVEQVLETYHPVDVYPLVAMQEGIYVYSQYDDGSATYLQQVDMRVVFDEGYEVQRLKEAMVYLIERHEMLRANVLQLEDGRLVEFIREKPEGEYFYCEDLAGHEDIEEEIAAFKKARRQQQFDLVHGALFQLVVHCIDKRSCHLTWTYHHIILDRGSIVRLISQFLSHVAGNISLSDHQEGEAKRVSLGGTSYREYIRWLNRLNKKAASHSWHAYLEGFTEPSSLPILEALPAGKIEYLHQEVKFSLEAGVMESLYGMMEENKVSLEALMRALWGVLLGKYNGRYDVVFGAVLAVGLPEIEDEMQPVGLMINTVPVRVRFSSELNGLSFLNLVQQLYREALEMEPFSRYPLAKIQESTLLKHNLLDHILVVEPESPGEILFKAGIGNGCMVANVDFFDHTHFEFNITVTQGEGLTVTMTCNGNVYKASYVQRVVNHFHYLLEQVVVGEGVRIGDLQLLTEAEREQITREFNDTAADFPVDMTIVDMFNRQVSETPGLVAVMIPESELEDERGKGRLTYGELWEWAGQLAGVLVEKGVGIGDIVAIMLERSPVMIGGLFGILSAGAGYLPISPQYPVERIEYMIKDSGAKVLITDGSVDKSLIELLTVKVTQISMEDNGWRGDKNWYWGEKKQEKGSLAGPGDLAYVIYTSGSTGKPKGAMIEHRSLVNRLHWMQKAYPIEVGDVILQKTSFVFDVSLWELFWWSFRGAAVCMLGAGDEKYPDTIIEVIEQVKVTVMHFVPSMLNLFLDYLEAAGSYEVERLRSLRRVFASGEALANRHVQRFHQLLTKSNQIELVNLYGPTEATVDVSYFNCVRGEQWMSIPIGRPIDNIKLWVVGHGMKLQPIGIPGELFISGVGVSRGYLNNPELTAEKFIPYERFSGVQGAVFQKSPLVTGARRQLILPSAQGAFYKTGDLVKWLPDGNIEFLGRMDFQVKVRGYRIELGEIENRLLAHESIKDVVVLANSDGMGEKILCAYIVLVEGGNVGEQELKQFLARDLPGYMIPVMMVFLKEIPLTVNGKVDRKALAGMKTVVSESPDAGIFVDPSNEIEKTVSVIWKEVLGIEKISIDTNFFDIGGNSLKGILVVSQLKKRLNRDIPIVTMFRYSTIRALAMFLSQEEVAPVRKDRTEEKAKGMERLEQRRRMRNR